jgi:hypothetical protein
MIKFTNRNTKINFVQQQGYSLSPEECLLKYPTLIFQPKVLIALFFGFILFDLKVGFFYVSILLAFCAAFPRLNPLDILYRLVLPKQSKYVSPALAPRRFDQLFGSLLCLVSFVADVNSMNKLFWSTCSVLLGTTSLAVFGNYWFASPIYYFFLGKIRFAVRSIYFIK